ncbi:DUF885 family protein [Caulobacter sp. NIBR1757]|uniref:DUF885 domain-containing protein n=1 Tax=Caulobacter sp. NIBR1757 TaxID=3016000 RepID=UPI0022F051DD|nr:DUF885 family protein [Caulobacter sp. NIBR1757]WGM39696.1 hypothetical protein AMEJIAPC_02622 [Caulobacter sp. NIBR1757]
MMNRRELFASATALAALAAAPRLASAAAPTGEAAKMYAQFDRAMDEAMRRSPELPTYLGIDNGAMAWSKSLLSDNSRTANLEARKDNTRQLAELRTIDRKSLTGMDAVNYDTVEFVLAVQEEGNSKFDYNGGGSGAPYVLSQLTGSYQSTPDFLDTAHSIETKDDADAYLSRMECFARNLDNEAETARHDAGIGVIPPDFVIAKAITQMKSFLSTKTEETTLVSSLVRRVGAAKIEGDYAKVSTALYNERVKPALQRQLELLESWQGKAVHDAGVKRLPKGEEYYAVSLKNYTTSEITPEEVHKTGLELVKSLGAKADVLMKKAGLSKGTVGERYAAIYADPKQHWPNTDEGKDALIASLNEQAKEVQAKLPQWFGQLPKAPVEIRRVPKAIEAGAPGGYYNSPSLDGKRPGIYWINLRDTAEQPKFVLPTLTYHEAIPGHHLQLALNNEAGDLPLIRKVIGFSGYSEGWALYAEELAVEMGMYKGKPLDEAGMIHDAMFRAVRLVVDSGMHYYGWSREQAVKYYVDNIGDQESGAITEIERYCVWPGQACSYMVGKLTFLKARAKAKKELGGKFDIRKFHDAVLLSGGTPLEVLEHVVDDYIAATKAGK